MRTIEHTNKVKLKLSCMEHCTNDKKFIVVRNPNTLELEHYIIEEK